MLKKASRLDRRALEAFFHKKTAYAAGNLLYIRYVRNDLKNSRFGVVISFEGGTPKKGRAVLRNLVKRRILGAVRLLSEEIPAGWDMVIFAKLNSRVAPKFAELKKDINHVLHRSRISRNIL